MAYVPLAQAQSQFIGGSNAKSPSGGITPGYVPLEQQQKQFLSTNTGTQKPISTSGPVKIAPNSTNIFDTIKSEAKDVANTIIKGITFNFVTPKLQSPIPQQDIVKPQPATPSKPISLVPNQNKLNPDQLKQLQPNFSSPQQPGSGQAIVTPKSLQTEKKSVDQTTKTIDTITNFTQSLKDQYKQGIKDVSKGIVPNMNQVNPKSEYMNPKTYQQAVETSKQEQQGKFSTPAEINRLLAAAVIKPIQTTSFGVVKGNFQQKNELERVSAAIAEAAPLAVVPIKSLVKFTAISIAFDNVLQKITGKQSVSELLPENTPDWAKTGVDVLELLGKAYVAHKIDAGAIREAFTKQTLESHGIPQTYVFTPQEVQDVVIGKNTGIAKDVLSKAGLSSEEWKTAVKSGAKVDIPAEKIITMTDKPYWAKLKGLIGISPSEAKQVRTSGGTQVTNVAGLLKSGENTPQEIINTVLQNGKEKTPEGKALIKTATQAQQRQQNIMITKDGEEPTTTTQKEPSTQLSEVSKPYDEHVAQNKDSLVADYQKQFGNVINTDNAKELLRPQGYTGLNVTHSHAAAAEISNAVYDKALKEEKGKGNNTVYATLGGTGSGKSSRAAMLPKANADFSITLDSTGANAEYTQKNIQKALDNGFKVKIAYTYRDPIDAWKNGALNRERHVPESVHVNTHMKSRDTFLKMYETFQDNPNVEFFAFKNETGKSFTKLKLEDVKKIAYNKEELTKQIQHETENHYQAKDKKNLTEEKYRQIERERGSNKPDNKGEQASTKKSSESDLKRIPNYVQAGIDKARDLGKTDVLNKIIEQTHSYIANSNAPEEYQKDIGKDGMVLGQFEGHISFNPTQIVIHLSDGRVMDFAYNDVFTAGKAKPYTAPEKAQNTIPEANTEAQTPVGSGKVKASKAYSRVIDRLSEETQMDVNYNRLNLAKDAEKAMEFVTKDPKQAIRVALGLESPPEGQTETAISIALADKAYRDGDMKLASQLEAARSLRQTRRGQEIVSERGRFNENSPYYYIRELMDRRLKKLGYSYAQAIKDAAVRVAGKAGSLKQVAIDKIDEKTARLREKLKKDQVKINMANDILERIKCK